MILPTIQTNIKKRFHQKYFNQKLSFHDIFLPTFYAPKQKLSLKTVRKKSVLHLHFFSSQKKVCFTKKLLLAKKLFFCMKLISPKNFFHSEFYFLQKKIKYQKNFVDQKNFFLQETCFAKNFFNSEIKKNI